MYTVKMTAGEVRKMRLIELEEPVHAKSTDANPSRRYQAQWHRQTGPTDPCSIRLGCGMQHSFCSRWSGQNPAAGGTTAVLPVFVLFRAQHRSIVLSIAQSCSASLNLPTCWRGP